MTFMTSPSFNYLLITIPIDLHLKKKIRALWSWISGSKYLPIILIHIALFQSFSNLKFDIRDGFFFCSATYNTTQLYKY